MSALRCAAVALCFAACRSEVDDKSKEPSDADARSEVCDAKDGRVQIDNCYRELATKSGKLAHCALVAGPEVRDTCLAVVAASTKNADACKRVADEQSRDRCYQGVAKSAKDVALCEPIVTTETRCQCVNGVAVDRMDARLCKSIPLRASRIYCVAAISAHAPVDVAVCSELPTPIERDRCILRLYEVGGNGSAGDAGAPSGCERVANGKLRDTCWTETARSSPTLCEKLSTHRAQARCIEKNSNFWHAQGERTCDSLTRPELVELCHRHGLGLQTSVTGARLDPTIADGIHRIDPVHFTIARGVVDRILENQAELMRSARIVPVTEKGNVTGIKLFGVRSDTLFGALGIENADELRTINGFDISSPERALEAYARLRTAEQFTVTIQRRGKPIEISYTIVR